jgi:hypothetical protein
MAKRHVHTHRPVKKAKQPWVAADPAIVSPYIQEALRQAMALEDVPESEFDDLLWIMAQESRGIVDVRNPKSTARGLFQLLKNQYSLNPHGEKSFGNAIEECQGGIR